MNRAHALMLSAVAVSGLALTACAAAPEKGPSTTGIDSDFIACAVSGSGGWNDASFNQQVYDALQQAKADGVDIIAFESQTPDDFAPGLNSLVEQGCTLIFSVGFDANDAVNEAAATNPDVNFVTVDGYVIDDATTNLKAVTYKMSESSYLAGYVAAAHSTSHVVGTFGAVQNDAITDFMTGYYNGAKAWEADSGTSTEVVGWDPRTATGSFVGDFTNQVNAQSIAKSQLDQDADVLFPVAGSLFTAAATAIEDASSNAVFIGVDSDIAVTSPDFADITLTSVEKRMTGAVVSIIGAASKGQFDSAAYVGEIANDGTGLASFHDFESAVSSELRAKLDELSERIKSGDLDTMKP